MTLSEKRQAKKVQANKEAKLQFKICMFSIVLIVGFVLYTAINNGIANNEVFIY